MLTIFTFATLLTGCFEAKNRFYADSDVITDNRFEGSFQPQITDNDSAIRCSALVKLDRDKHYTVTVREGKDWIELDAVLFKADTHTFVDISQLADSREHIDSGEKTSYLAILRRITNDKNHVAIRFEFVENGIEGQLALGVPFVRAINKDPTLKLKKVDDHFAVLLDATEHLRSFLSRVGNDPSVFMQKVRWLKTDS
jgi:hypothetical protein